jgi:hypothetical protein
MVTDRKVEPENIVETILDRWPTGGQSLRIYLKIYLKGGQS